MELTTKVCSRCNKDKSLSEFYKQKDRYESLCKKCKKEARFNRERESEVNSFKSDNKFQKLDTLSKLPSTKRSFESNQFYEFETESMPEFDESIFYPERKMIEWGLTKDDVADLLCVLRWQMEQKDKRLKSKSEESL